jgi:hypothetical protein
MTHKVKSHNWASGILEVCEHVVETLEEAVEYVAGLVHHSSKIYDHDDNLVKEVSGHHHHHHGHHHHDHHHNTYA